MLRVKACRNLAGLPRSRDAQKKELRHVNQSGTFRKSKPRDFAQSCGQRADQVMYFRVLDLQHI
jgi:hypothetical protein